MKQLYFFQCFLVLGAFLSCTPSEQTYFQRTAAILQDSILLLAHQYIQEPPITITSSISTRSEGGIHDFYSEGDYWWPDSLNPEGPYIRRDGLTNPENFTDHRKAVMRLSEITGTLTSAYLLTGDEAYAQAVLRHCQAWFVDTNTFMTPHLLYAQAIKGRFSGRGIGIIDAIHFMEVVQSLRVLERENAISATQVQPIKDWFAEFVNWLATHPYGEDEMSHPNNHGTCWNMQVGLYAVFTDNDSILDFCRNRYRSLLLPKQMALDGSFPLELERTKPYGYSLFNLDAMVMNCLVLSDKMNDLWIYQTQDGKSILKGLQYMQGFVADKSSWPLPPDVMYWEQWPVAQPAYIFGGIYFKNEAFFDLWENRKHFLEVEEVKRNVPIKNPLLWIST